MVENEDDLFSELEKQFDDLDISDIQTVTTLENMALVSAFSKVELELRELQELHVPKTQRGRDLHSKRYSYQLEMRRRGLM